LRPAEDFNPLDAIDGERGEVEEAGSVAGIVERDAVEEDFGVLGVGAAEEDRGDAAWITSPNDIDTESAAEDFGDGGLAAARRDCIDFFGGDDGERTAGFAGGCGDAVGREDGVAGERVAGSGDDFGFGELDGVGGRRGIDGILGGGGEGEVENQEPE
jgi:hypothetical protein